MTTPNTKPAETRRATARYNTLRDAADDRYVAALQAADKARDAMMRAYFAADVDDADGSLMAAIKDAHKVAVSIAETMLAAEVVLIG